MKKGHDDVVELLCKEGADLNAKDIVSSVERVIYMMFRHQGDRLI